MRSLSLFAAALLSVTLGMANAHAQSEKKIMIAVGGPMTGDDAAAGKQILDGAQFAVDHINGQGGIAAGPMKGATIEIKVFDDKDDPQLGVTVARQVTSDNSFLAYVGSALSDVSKAEGPVFERAEMPLLSVYAAANSILDPPKKYVFIFPPTFDAYAYSVANMLGKNKVPSVGVIHLTGTYGSLMSEFFVKRCKELGIDVVGNEPFNFGDTDFRAQLTKIKANNPKAMALIGLIGSDALQLKQMKELGLSVPAYDGGGVTFNQDFLNAAGSEAEGLIGPTPTDPQRKTPATEQLIQLWNAKYHTTVIPDASAFTWEAFLAIKQAVEAGATGRKELAQYLHNIKIDDTGIAPLAFAPSGARTGGRLWIYQVQNGQFKFLTGYVQKGTFDLQEIPLER